MIYYYCYFNHRLNSQIFDKMWAGWSLMLYFILWTKKKFSARWIKMDEKLTLDRTLNDEVNEDM